VNYSFDRQLKSGLFLFSVIFLGLVGSAQADQVSEAKGRLSRQLELLQTMEPYIERPDLGELYFLREATTKALKAIEEDKVFNPATWRKFEELVFDYRYSDPFFKEIDKMGVIHDQVQEILAIYQSIVKDYGFNEDESPFTRIANIFTQVKLKTGDLMKLPIPESLRSELIDLQQKLGDAIAQGRAVGDTPPAFDVATPLYCKILELYPAFDQIASSDRAFELVLQIQGLNLLYGNFARVKTEKVGTSTSARECPNNKINQH
jgi:tetratricopeptide (TPR) repeat protein